jgi:hypothetical protein
MVTRTCIQAGAHDAGGAARPPCQVHAALASAEGRLGGLGGVLRGL